jgi:hypothetical protein
MTGMLGANSWSLSAIAAGNRRPGLALNTVYQAFRESCQNGRVPLHCRFWTASGWTIRELL